MLAREPQPDPWDNWSRPDGHGDPCISVALPPDDPISQAAVERAAADCREALSGLTHGILLENAPPAIVRPLRTISGYAPAMSDRRSKGETITLSAWGAPDGRGRVWPHAPTYWKYLYLHESAHVLVSDATARRGVEDKWGGGHSPVFTAVELVMLIRHDRCFPEFPRLATRADLYDIGFDQPGLEAMNSPSPTWRGNEMRDWGWTVEWTVRTAQRLAATDLTVERCSDVIVARWLRIIEQWKRVRAYATGQMRVWLNAKRAGFQAGQDAAVAAMHRRATAALREREKRRRRRAWVAVSGAFVVAAVVGVLVAFL